MLVRDRPHGWWILAACAVLAVVLLTTSMSVLNRTHAQEATAGAAPGVPSAETTSAPAAADLVRQPIDFSHTRHVVRAGIAH